jgi:hypothetical protein
MTPAPESPFELCGHWAGGSRFLSPRKGLLVKVGPLLGDVATWVQGSPLGAPGRPAGACAQCGSPPGGALGRRAPGHHRGSYAARAQVATRAVGRQARSF